uniref:Uncharacterized protein n=1 Tax=Anguilla anguilla TaxID=7936 RepID=A0A0E9TVX1_ANGAN
MISYSVMWGLRGPLLRKLKAIGEMR